MKAGQIATLIELTAAAIRRNEITHEVHASTIAALWELARNLDVAEQVSDILDANEWAQDSLEDHLFEDPEEQLFV